MYFDKYSKYKPSNSSICESYIKPIGVFGNYKSKCPEIRRKRRPISLYRVPPRQSNEAKDYISSVGSPCNEERAFLRTCEYVLNKSEKKVFKIAIRIFMFFFGYF